jgi:hypothetical protein
MVDLFRKKIAQFVERFGTVRTVVYVLLIAIALYSFIVALPAISERIYYFLLYNFRASLVGMVILWSEDSVSVNSERVNAHIKFTLKST